MTIKPFPLLALTILLALLPAKSQSIEPSSPPPPGRHDLQIFPLSTTDVCSYAPSLCYRYDAATGKLAATATATYGGGAVQESDPGNGIDWDGFTHWHVRFPAGSPEAAAVLIVDLGQAFTMNCIHLWMDSAASCKAYEITGSLDGVNFNIPLVPKKSPTSDFNGICNDKFPAVSARYVRLFLNGAGSAATSAFTVRYFEIFAADSGSPLTTRDGFAAVGLPGIKQINVSKNWKRFDNALQYRLDSSGWDPTGATAETVGMVDLGAIEPLAAIYLGFCGPGAAWEHGGKVELSIDGKTWSTVFDSPVRLSNGKIPLPAITDARYLRITDKFDGSIGSARLGAVLPMIVSDAPPPVAISSVTTPDAACKLSAAVYDRNGRLLRHLLMASPQQATQRIDLYWDGRDMRGRALPAGAAYEIRTIANHITGAFDGVVGNTAPLPFNRMSMPPVYTTGVATDPAENLYTSSPGDEDSQNLRKLNAADGSAAWTIAGLPLIPGVASDGDYVYASGHAPSANPPTNNGLYRVHASTGAPAPFDGKTGNFAAYAEASAGSLALAADHDPAIHLTRVWCLLNDCLEVINGNTGELLGTPLALDQPQGIAVQNAPSAPGTHPEKPGALWICFADGTIRKFAWTVDAAGVPALSPTEVSISTGLSHPRALAFGGPERLLYVADVDAPDHDTAGKLHGVIKLYEVNGPPKLAEQFGTMQHPGTVTSTSFLWKGQYWDHPSLAVNGAGQVVATDIGDGRVQWLNADHTLFKTYLSDGVACPTITHITPTTYDVYNMGRLYQVNVRDKTWSLIGNYRSNDGHDWGWQGGWIRTIEIPGKGKRDFLFCWQPTDTWIGKPKPLIGMSVYALEEGGARLCAIVSGATFGLSPADGHTYRGREVWTDLNGNGEFDPGEWTSDPTYQTGANCRYQDVAMFADEGGNIWIGDYIDDTDTMGSVVELPVAWEMASNGKVIPHYDWTTKKCIVASPGDSEPDYKNNNFLVQLGAHIAPGSPERYVYQLGEFPGHVGYCNGVAVLRISDTTGALHSIFEMPGATDSPFGSLNGLAPDIEDGSGLFFTDSVDLTGYGGSISAWSGDGMLLAQVYPDAYLGPMGWPDRIYSLGILRMPGDAPGTRRFCMEDDGQSRICLATLNGVDTATIPRTSRLATWPAVPNEQLVELRAIAPVADRQSQTPGTMRFIRIGDNLHPLTVKYTVGGSAISGKDYVESLSGSIVVPAGRTYADQPITPVASPELTGDSSVMLTLSDTRPDYSLSQLSTAEVRLADHGSCPGVNVVATTSSARKGGPPGVFRIARTTAGSALTVYYRLSGTAVRGADQDFTTPFPASVQIPNGAEYVDIPIVPLLDAHDQPGRSVTLTLLANRAGYSLDTSPGKSITDTVIIDNARIAPSPQIFWNFGVDAWDPNPTAHNPHLAVSPMSAGFSSITPQKSEHGFFATLNGWDMRKQCYTFSLTVEEGCVLSLTDWSMRWAVQVNPGKLSLVIDGATVSTAAYPASDHLPADPARYEMTHVVLRPGEHTIKLLCTLGHGPSALLDDLTFSGTMVSPSLSQRIRDQPVRR